MSDAIRGIERFGAKPTLDGAAIELQFTLDDGARTRLRLDSRHVDPTIAMIIDANSKVAQLAGAQFPPFSQRDDEGLWLRPTLIGLIDAPGSDDVYLAIRMGPTVFRFRLAPPKARQIATAILAATAPRSIGSS